MAIHSKSEKVCGTAFSVKKNLRKKCVNPGVIFGTFGVILGYFGSFLGHVLVLILFGQKCISAIFIIFCISVFALENEENGRSENSRKTVLEP